MDEKNGLPDLGATCIIIYLPLLSTYLLLLTTIRIHETVADHTSTQVATLSITTARMSGSISVWRDLNNSGQM